ncbi:MAG: hypothetical protein ABIN36_11470 [Ferruginibacter sp.]
MRIVLLFIFSTLIAPSLSAQCIKTIQKNGLEPDMFLWGYMGDDLKKMYVAKIESVSGNGFNCKFLHSNSQYVFDGFTPFIGGKALQKATVNSSKGGKYPRGTIFHFTVFVADKTGICNLDLEDIQFQECITTFNDGRSYLGNVMRNKGNYIVSYYHSYSIYEFDSNWVIKEVTNGSYKIGEKVTSRYAHSVDFK